MTSYLTVKQVAELAQRHPETVTLALRMGELHGTQPRPKATWRIKQECAEAWVESRLCEHKQNVTPIHRP